MPENYRKKHVGIILGKWNSWLLYDKSMDRIVDRV